MIRLLLLAILAFLVYTFVTTALRLLQWGRRMEPRNPSTDRRGESMVKDPVCGTYLPPGDAVTLRRHGETLHFCSTECRDKYLGDQKSET